MSSRRAFMNYTDPDLHIIILSKDKENTLLLTAAFKATRLKIKSVKAARDLKAAEKLILKKKPSLLFLDVTSTPAEKSLAGLTAVNRGMPIIVITDRKNEKFAYTLLENGAADFFKKTKHYDPLLLEKSIRFSIETKITAESLRLSNERYELVSKAANDMVWDWDLLNNRVFRSADGWDRLFGKTQNNESDLADSWWDRVHPDDKKNSNRIIENVLKDGLIKNFEIECRIRRNDNTYATVVDRGYAIRNTAGEITRLVGATQDITERKAAEERFAEERRLRQDEVTHAVITAQEQEREDLGKELHDNINQILATTKLYIEYALSNDEMHDRLLNNAKDLVESAVSEIRRLSKTLSPPSLGEVGIIMALNELTESMQTVNKFQIIKDWEAIKEESFSEGLKLTVFRIIQEQLTNISRHADAKKVWISLKITGRRLSVIIKDNGNGFDLNKKMNGVGLKNIFSRAQLHKGKVTLNSAKGKGCELKILFNL